MQTIRIRNERPYFWQWDQHQQVEISGVEEPCQVHFTQQDSAEGCLVVKPQREGDLLVAAVPNILLQTAAPITVYIYRCDEARYTDRHAVFNVAAREKPTDYVYTETEVLTWEALKAYCEEHAVTPNLQIGEVTTLPAGSAAQASISGSTANPILHLGIPTGAAGKDGGQGIPGISPTVEITDIEGGHRVTVTDAGGAHAFDVMDGAVQSVNGKTGTVQLSASDVGASPAETWNGKPVYTKLVDCGELGTSNKFVDTGVSKTDYDIIGFEGYIYGAFLIVAKRANVDIQNSSGSADYEPNYYIRVMDIAGFTPETCKVQIRYVTK